MIQLATVGCSKNNKHKFCKSYVRSECIYVCYKYKFCIRIRSVTPTGDPYTHKSVISISSE